MIFVTIFLVCFVLIAGVVMFLSKTIEHGEARFDDSGKQIKKSLGDTAENTGPARPAQRIETSETKAKDDE